MDYENNTEQKGRLWCSVKKYHLHVARSLALFIAIIFDNLYQQAILILLISTSNDITDKRLMIYKKMNMTKNSSKILKNIYKNTKKTVE